MKKSSSKKKRTEETSQSTQQNNNKRSELSTKGGKTPLSLYTRRVIDISNISKFLTKESTHGLCGGKNLGNTCFMNSSIACISNCTELTYYFLSGDYIKDINKENKLGMGGKLAMSWGALLQQYWVEKTRVGNPAEFKKTLGDKVKMFRGFGQQDSNEFMSVFLDYLNEDLNRITKKEYIELKEKQENETDEQCAKRFWECNLKRNDSIVTDLFCGQFKSTITCPDCHWVNITFDPFYTINLPLLTQVKRRSHYSENIDEFKFHYITKYDLRNPYCVIVKDVNSKEMLKDLIDRIKKEKDFICHDKLDNLLTIDMLRGEKYDFVKRTTDTLSKFNYSQEYLYSYNYKEENDDIKMLSYFFQDNEKSEYPRMVFVKKKSNLNEIRKKLYIYLRKYILSPFSKENEEKDSLSLEIEKYIEDKKLELDVDKLIELIEKEYEEVFKYEEEDNEKEKKDEEEDDNDSKKDEEKNKEEKTDEEKKEEEKKEEEKKEEAKNDDSKEKNKEEEKKEIEKDEKKKYIDNFIQDLPFTIFFRREKDSYNNSRVLFLGKDNFFKLPKEFKKKFDLKSFKDILDNSYKDFEDYEITVIFNKDSKYINKNTFDLNRFEKYSLDYKKKKEEPKKEEEEESGIMTLEKCLKKFCKEEQLEEGDEWYCSKCKKHVLAKKKLDLFYLPKILIICLKRFVKDSDSSYWDKNDDEVDFPVNDMDLKNFVTGPDKDHSKYDLFAVSQHYGGTGGGHYTAVCKNIDGNWYSYNDSSVSSASASSAVTSAAYVLFYRRKNW